MGQHLSTSYLFFAIYRLSSLSFRYLRVIFPSFIYSFTYQIDKKGVL